MRRNDIVVVMCILFLTFLNIGHSDSEPLNIIVIIDTSDRISNEKHPDQRERDINILKEVIDQFYEMVKPTIMKGGTIENPHRFTCVVPPQSKTQKPPDEITNKLTIVAPKKRSANPAFQKKKKELIDAISELYNHVQQHPQTGSDIWDWFRSQANSTFEEDYQNLIICLSDGYLNFDIGIEANRHRGMYMRVGALRNNPEKAISEIKNGGEGLLPVGKFSNFNIKFWMLEIRLREEDGVKHFQDFDIIQAYWKTWLNAMDIRDTKFSEQLNLGGLRNEIEKVIKSPTD